MIGAQTLSPANHRSGCHPRPRLRIIFQALQPVSLPLASTKLSSLVHKTVLWDERKGHEMLGQQSAFPSQVSCPTYREHLRAFDATTKIIIRASHHLESFERLELTARFSDAVCIDDSCSVVVLLCFGRLAGGWRQDRLHNVR